MTLQKESKCINTYVRFVIRILKLRIRVENTVEDSVQLKEIEEFHLKNQSYVVLVRLKNLFLHSGKEKIRLMDFIGNVSNVKRKKDVAKNFEKKEDRWIDKEEEFIEVLIRILKGIIKKDLKQIQIQNI